MCRSYWLVNIFTVDTATTSRVPTGITKDRTELWPNCGAGLRVRSTVQVGFLMSLALSPSLRYRTALFRSAPTCSTAQCPDGRLATNTDPAISQNTILSAATGATEALALRPAGVNNAPTLTPMRLLKLYSTAGASVNTSLEPKSC